MKRTRRLMIISGNNHNYFLNFENKELKNGEKIEIDQAPWADIELTSYPDTGLVIHIKPNAKPFPNTNQSNFRTFQPDFVLLRSYPLGNYEHDWRNKLYAIYHADIPAVNSIDSFIWSVEKASLYTKLLRVQKRIFIFI